MKKFIVSLVFTVDETDVMNSADRLEYFLREHGYFFFQGEKDNEYVEDTMVEAHEMSVIVREVDC